MTRRADFQTGTRYFTARGPSNLPIIAVYTENSLVSAVVPGIATSKGAVQALAQRFAMQTVVDVLEIEGRRALLPDFVISNILGQLQVNTTYKPLQCQLLMKPGDKQAPMVSCIYVGSTVTGICPAEAQPVQQKSCQEVAKAIDGQHLSLSGTLTRVVGKGKLFTLGINDLQSIHSEIAVEDGNDFMIGDDQESVIESNEQFA
ncbi:hypothetical protein KIN20_019232 [Parelaphostrongylus tenuis]|uniref:Uncharacterized protein n=1 Tax=Parelaphostrongylus tenuis TaxID=148309 RepID=A0AAD5QQ38_PARTN|nr:hypothetical protein KIN20_019232 [Parelaphostrongylus tenuis]